MNENGYQIQPVNRWKSYGGSKSLERQDEWVLNLLSEKTNGTYLEIGAGHPVDGSNTFLLESEFSWIGIGIEIDEALVNLHRNMRKNPCINTNAISEDYRKILKEYEMPKNIDYLQIDIDFSPEYANMLALIAIPFTEYSFSTITIEHGCVNDYKMSRMRDGQRLILESFGYRLIVQGDNEDWWINQKEVGYEKYSSMFSVGQLRV